MADIAGPARKSPHQVARRFVEVLDVLDDEERRLAEAEIEEANGDLGQAVADEFLLERRSLGAVGHVEAEEDGEQWRPRHEVGIHGRHSLGQPCDARIRRDVGINVEHVAHQRPEGEIWRRGLVLLAAGAEDPEVRRTCD